RLVERLRASGSMVRALVAEERGRLLGHVAVSRLAIGEKSVTALAPAPLAVMPAFQRLGIGTALVSAGPAQLRLGGHQRGFVPAAGFGLQCPFPVPPEAFMAASLARNAFHGVSGMVAYGHEFDDLE